MRLLNPKDMLAPFSAVAGGKGISKLFKRARLIGAHYGWTSAQMERALDRFVQVLVQHRCAATFPVTAVVLARHGDILRKYQSQGIEFAIHGYSHIDYTKLSQEEQLTHLRLARQIFAKAGIRAEGFRSPYLSRNAHLPSAIQAMDLTYSSNQPILWNMLEKDAITPATRSSYERAITFYDPWRADERLGVPRLNGKLVEIPVSLPDDEILLDRLNGSSNGLVEKVWRHMLAQTYQHGELFTLQLHPERIAGCIDGLAATLAEARTLMPSVWLARLGEISAWWKRRAETGVEIKQTGDMDYHVTIAGPAGTTVLARAVETDAPTTAWAGKYRQVKSTTFSVHTARRPFVGLSPAAAPNLASFLRQQGYIVEISQHSPSYACYFGQTQFDIAEERLLVDRIESSDTPLVKLGRWPNGSQSALAVTGDIDALTLWDYGSRFLGK